MAQHYNPHIVTDSLKLLIDPKDDVCNGGKSVMRDLSGNSISASLYSGNGLKFDGSADHYIEITGSSKADIDEIGVLGTGGEFVMSAWIYPTSDANEQYIYAGTTIGVTYGGGWALQINGKGSSEWELAMGNSLGSDASPGSTYGFWGGTTANFPINKWHHVAQTRESDGWHYLWVNGTKYGWGTGIRDDGDSRQLTLNEDWPGKPGKPLWIGGWSNGAYNFTGYMSNLRIYKGAGTSTIVGDLYNSPNKVLSGNVSSSQLKLWLPLTERYGATAHDGSGNEFNGTIINSPTWVSSSADIPQLGSKGFSKKMLFDGSDDYVSIANSSNWDILTDGAAATIACWLKFNTHAGEDYIIAQRESDVKYWALRHSDGSGGFHFSVYNTSSTIIDSGYQGEVEDNEWHHIAMTKDASDNYILYKDGSVIGSFSDSSDVNFDGPLHIGVLNSGADHFDGLIDEVAIWNTNLSAGAVQELAASSSYGLPTPMDARNVSGSNLGGYYRNNGKGEETWNDLSGNTATVVTPTGSPKEIYFPEGMEKGRDSQGMFLTNPNEGWFDFENNNTTDTAGQYVHLGTSTLAATGPITVCLWLYAPIRGQKPLVNFKTGGGLIVYADSGGEIFMGFLGEHKMTTSGTTTRSAWNHVAAVYDGNDDDLVGSYKIYINTVSQTLSRTGASIGGSTTVNMIGNDIGTTSWGVNPFEKGRIAAVSLYEKALSSVEVLQNYNAQFSRFESISEDYWQ